MGLALVAEKQQTPGEWLKAIREEKGISQRELGEAVGKTDANAGQYISGVERDKWRPPVEFCDTWAKKLKVPENEIRLKFGYKEIRTTQEEANREILSYLAGASPKGQEMMRAVLKKIYEVDLRQSEEDEAATTEEVPEARKWPRDEDGQSSANNK